MFLRHAPPPLEPPTAEDLGAPGSPVRRLAETTLWLLAEHQRLMGVEEGLPAALATRTEQVREVMADLVEDYRDESPRSGETDDALGELARRIRALRVREIEETIGARAASIPATGGGEP